MRFGVSLLFSVLIWAGPALSATSFVMNDKAGPCLAPEGSFETLVTKVESYGWTTIQTANDTLVEDLAWIHAVFYLGGDTGGASLDEILDIQRKAAHGLLRKRDIPQSKSSFFQHDAEDGSETLMLAWRKPQETTLEVDCRYSLREPAPEFEYVDDANPFVEAQHFEVGNARVQVTHFNRTLFPEQTPPSTVIHTEYLKVLK